MNFWQGERITLRAVEPGDAAFFFTLQQDTERGRLLDFLPPPSSKAALETWAREQSQKELENDVFQWIIEAAGEPVGSIVTHTVSPRNGTFSYGLEVARNHQRKGYAKEAVTLVLHYYFGELRYQKAHISVQENNAGSLALHRSSGFKHEGTQRRMVFQKGRYLDLLLFGLTADELDGQTR